MRIRSGPGFGRVDGVAPGLVRPRTIRGQLARILLVSLTLVFALLGIAIAGEVQSYWRSGDTVAEVGLALAVQDVLHEAQRERGLSNGLFGGGALESAVAEQRGNTDRAVRALDAALTGHAPGIAAVRRAVAPLSGLGEIRAGIDTRRIARAAAFQFYTDAIDALNRLELGLDQADDAEIRHGLQALYALAEAKEQTARERGFLNGVFAAEAFGPGEYVRFLEIRAAKLAGLAAFARDATAAQRELLDAALRGENAVRSAESENLAIGSGGGPLARPVDSNAWWAQMTAVIDAQGEVQQAVGAAVRDRAADLRTRAAVTLAGFVLLAVAALAAEIALVIASLRAIVRPLATLADEADEVASRRLPEVIAAWQSADTEPDPPAPVRTPPGASIEIADVADALDRVQRTAYELSSQQALLRRNNTESMANLARRNQNLVRRQLGLISEFERAEMDPKALANLFELDHLATRMRRNAESLLVLVGATGPRRWAAPIPLTDVIRAGISEVDDYRRVALRRIEEVTVSGAAGSELAHMLAELIENGLAFSPPDLEVEIYGRVVPDGYVLAVVDHGVGMPAEQLAEANSRLRGASDFLLTPTRYLGHYVVGRLARRLGIEVELTVSPVSGVVARLLLPAELLGATKSPPVDTGLRPAVLGRGVFAESGRKDSEPGTFGPVGSAAPSEPELPGLVSHTSGRVISHDRPARPVSRKAGQTTDSVPTAHGGRILADAAATMGVGPHAYGAGVPETPADSGRVLGAPGTDVTDEPQRTRNGLVKRVKRARPVEAESPRGPAPSATSAQRSPEQVRGLLSAFRAGHQRGGETLSSTSDPAIAMSTVKGRQ
ncbi:nitrate- and nitrite sensing domain-containing protein [Nocardia sp. NPDC127579]|uniref:sensor histidine kinase n=1 Tax=Nocardia sp. NPDC127579 TaxID=3345402 RepID=UPI00362A5813